MMQINDAGLEILKKFEGCKLASYQDPKGIWTIGFGSTEGVKKGQQITQEEADELLQEDLTRFEAEVNRCVKVPLNENEFSALVCFAYNVGTKNFHDSKLLAFLNRNMKEDAAFEIRRWDKIDGVESAGLRKRREAEKALFLTPIHS